MPNSKRSRDQLVRMSVLSVFAPLRLLHALIYRTSMFPHCTLGSILPLWLLAYAVEALTMMVGFHLYGLFHIDQSKM